MTEIGAIRGMLAPISLLMFGAFAHASRLDSLRLVRMRRVWLSITVGLATMAGCEVFLFRADRATPGWQEALFITLSVCGMGAVLFGLGFLVVRGARINAAVTKLQVIEDQGGVTSTDLPMGHRNPGLHLRQLLPLIEPLGHAPGHPGITPQWITARLQELEAHEAKALKGDR